MSRYILAFVCFFVIAGSVDAQIVTTEPEFPAPDGSVTVYFDATEGTGGLEGHQGDVYAHTGVLTEHSTNGSDWRYVVADWEDNIDKARMVRVGTDRYKLEISPTIREYYGVPPDEKITHMAFVFRNADGTKEGKAEGGEDIFVEVFDKTFNLKFVQPSDTLTFSKQSDSVHVKGIGSGEGSNISLSLSLNGRQVKQVNDDTLTYSFLPATDGRQELQLSGTDGTSSDTTASTVMVNPPVVDQPRPPGLRDGITYVDDTTVRLSLFAPYKDFIYVLGDFNNWEVQTDYFMKRDSVNADSVYYWMEINNLSPGKEYAFQYLVDGKIRLADPYTEKVLDFYNDPLITSSTYPNLKSYPAGKTEHLVGIMHPGKQNYSWQTTGYDRPEQEELIIYELLIRDFINEHDFKTLTDSLDYLDSLGVNAIELMPVMEFDANSSWGYNPTFHLATDKYYGPSENLKKFIDECHSRDIAVILDMVLNHAWGPSPIARLWNSGEYGKPTSENPYLNTEPRHDFNVGYDFNHESAATQYFVDRVNEYWLKEFKFDGFRFDLSKGFTQKNTLGNIGAWGEYDASRVRLLKRMADQIWAIDDSAYVILEHFSENREEKEFSNYGMMLWGNMNHNYSEAAMGYHDNNKSNFSGVYHGNRGWTKPHLVGYMESHDEERMMFRNLNYGNASAGGYNIKELSTALNRIKLSAAFFLTIPGPKMIWQFGELGYEVSIDENGRTGEKPIKWEYFSDEQRKNLYDTFKHLLRLRNSHEAFRSSSTDVTLKVDTPTKRILLTHSDLEVSIIGNFAVTINSVAKPKFSSTGTWYEFFSGDTLQVADTDTSISLDPGEFRIYTTKKFEQPRGNPLGSGGGDDGNNGGGKRLDFRLEQNYPNPFNPTTTIPYDLSDQAMVNLDVYDITGRRVLSIDIGEKPGGSHTYQLDLANLASGLYFYRLKAGNFSSTRKMMLIK